MFRRMEDEMKVNEIFNSIMGEVNPYSQGSFATFIRLHGCNLKCPYCDTDNLQSVEMSVKDICKTVSMYGCHKVLITGGEPLQQQKELIKLAKELHYNHFTVMIETNGTFEIDPKLRVSVSSFIVDYKLPSSGILVQGKEEWFKELWSDDYIKFVISNWEDYYIAKEKVKQWKSDEFIPPQIAFSPVHDNLSIHSLIETMKEDKLFNIILNVQIHKYINVR